LIFWLAIRGLLSFVVGNVHVMYAPRHLGCSIVVEYVSALEAWMSRAKCIPTIPEGAAAAQLTCITWQATLWSRADRAERWGDDKGEDF
jgi:hypothetical protein